MLNKSLSDDEEEEIKESRDILKGNGRRSNSDEDDEESDVEDFLTNLGVQGKNKEP